MYELLRNPISHFEGSNHMSGMTEARVLKFCTLVGIMR